MAIIHEVCYSLGATANGERLFLRVSEVGELRDWSMRRAVLATRSVLYRLQGVDIKSLCLEVTGDGV